MNEELFLNRCKELLETFRKDLSKDTIYLDSGDNSCIMNPNSKFYKLFGGQSIGGVAKYYAGKTGKKLKYIDD